MNNNVIIQNKLLLKEYYKIGATVSYTKQMSNGEISCGVGKIVKTSIDSNIFVESFVIDDEDKGQIVIRPKKNDFDSILVRGGDVSNEKQWRGRTIRDAKIYKRCEEAYFKQECLKKIPKKYDTVRFKTSLSHGIGEVVNVRIKSYKACSALYDIKLDNGMMVQVYHNVDRVITDHVEKISN